MTDWAHAGWLSENELKSFITDPAFAFSHMVLEAVDEVKFGSFQNDIDLSRFESGRVFNAAGEVQWLRDGTLFHTLLVGNLGNLPPAANAHSKELSDSLFDYRHRKYFLWGEYLTQGRQEWVEASIPRIFDYPQPAAAGRWRYMLEAIEYINLTTGEMEFYRFAGTKMEKL